MDVGNNAFITWKAIGSIETPPSTRTAMIHLIFSLERVRDLGAQILRCCIYGGIFVGLASCDSSIHEVELDLPIVIDTTEIDHELADYIGETVQSINEVPYSSALRGKLAMTYDVNNFEQAASEMYEQAAALDPREFSWWYFGALVDGKVGNFEDGLAKLSNAIEIDSGYVPAYLYQGTWTLQQEHLEKSRIAFESAARLGAGSPAAIGLAQVYLQQNNPQKVVDVLEPYAQSLPHPQISRLLAQAYSRLGRKDDAEVARALGRQSTSLTWIDPLHQRKLKYVKGFGRRMVYAQNLIKVDRYEEALRELETLSKIDSNDPALISSLAVAYEKTQQPEKAKEILEKGISLWPKQFRFYTQLGDLMYRAGHNEDALRLLLQSIEINEFDSDAHERLGTVHMRLNQFDEAVVAFQKAIEYGDANIDGIHLRIGTIYGTQSKWKDAIEQFSRVIDLDPSNAEGHVYLVHALIANEQVDEAADALDWTQRLSVNPTILESAIAALQEQQAEALARDE